MKRYIQTVLSIVLCLSATLVVADNDNNSIEYNMELFNKRLTRLEVILGISNKNMHIKSTILSRLDALESSMNIPSDSKKQEQAINTHSRSPDQQEWNYFRRKIQNHQSEINRLKSEVSRLASKQ